MASTTRQWASNLSLNAGKNRSTLQRTLEISDSPLHRRWARLGRFECDAAAANLAAVWQPSELCGRWVLYSCLKENTEIPGIADAVEDLHRDELISQAAVEALCVAVLTRTSRFDVHRDRFAAMPAPPPLKRRIAGLQGVHHCCQSLAGVKHASARRNFPTISSGRCFFRRLVIESLHVCGAVDLHADWIRISTAGHSDHKYVKI
jgi:hypothetical protein